MQVSIVLTGFGPAAFRRYEWDQLYSTRAYLDVLHTYSGHRALPAEPRAKLFQCIAQLIDIRFRRKKRPACPSAIQWWA